MSYNFYPLSSEAKKQEGKKINSSVSIKSTHGNSKDDKKIFLSKFTVEIEDILTYDDKEEILKEFSLNIFFYMELQNSNEDYSLNDDELIYLNIYLLNILADIIKDITGKDSSGKSMSIQSSIDKYKNQTKTNTNNVSLEINTDKLKDKK